MYQWKKNGLVFGPAMVKDRPWLREFAQAPCVLDCGDFLRIYFSCRPPADANGQYISHSSYVDCEKNESLSIIRVANAPILPLGETGTFDEFGIYPVSVIRNDDAIYAYYAGWTRCVSVPFNTAVGLAISHDDGQTFTKAGNGPVLSFSPDEPFVISGPKIRRFNGKLYLFYIAGRVWLMDNGKPEPVYRIRVATSDDGLTWRKENRDLLETRLGEEEAQASPDVFYINGTYHMFFCYRAGRNYRNRQNGYRIGYAWSKDLLVWHRDDSRAGIDVSPEGWDSEMVAYPHLFRHLGKIRMLYLGNQVGREGFGMATLEGDL